MLKRKRFYDRPYTAIHEYNPPEIPIPLLEMCRLPDYSRSPLPVMPCPDEPAEDFSCISLQAPFASPQAPAQIPRPFPEQEPLVYVISAHEQLPQGIRSGEEVTHKLQAIQPMPPEPILKP